MRIAERRDFGRLRCLTAAGTIGAAAQADAARCYWQDFDPGYLSARADAAAAQRNKRAGLRPEDRGRRKGNRRQAAGAADHRDLDRAAEGQGLRRQRIVRRKSGLDRHEGPFDPDGRVQRHPEAQVHHSNIYSGAPMPYMQRITWSGVAMHAGVLPGYPASHGCIRMPMAFAVKMWNWTRMGARVIVTPGEITPASFSHPQLLSRSMRRCRKNACQRCRRSCAGEERQRRGRRTARVREGRRAPSWIDASRRSPMPRQAQSRCQRTSRRQSRRPRCRMRRRQSPQRSRREQSPRTADAAANVRLSPTTRRDRRPTANRRRSVPRVRRDRRSRARPQSGSPTPANSMRQAETATTADGPETPQDRRRSQGLKPKPRNRTTPKRPRLKQG